MKALTRPRSDSGISEMAIASTLASWTEANSPWTKNASDVAITCVAGSRTSSRPSEARNAANCAPRTQGLRRPIGEPWKRSITGPQTNWTVQGMPIRAAKAAMTSGCSPR